VVHYFFGNLTYLHKITALRNRITLKTPPGEFTYMNNCPLPSPFVNRVSNADTVFCSLDEML